MPVLEVPYIKLLLVMSGYNPELYIVDSHIRYVVICHATKIKESYFQEYYNVDPVCVSIRPSFLFIDVSAIGLSETRYHAIVKICRQSGEFTGVNFSRL